MIVKLWTCEYPDYGGDPVGQDVSDFAVTHSPEALFWEYQVDDDYNSRVFSQWGSIWDTLPGTIEERPYAVSSTFTAELANILNGMPSTQSLPLLPELLPLAVQRYLLPSGCCQSEDPTIQAHAESLIAGCTKEYEAVLDIVNWCSDSLNYTAGVELEDALSILQDPAHEADCTGYSHLTIALLRAVGIPARIVASVTQPGEYEVPGPDDPAQWVHSWPLGFHATVEVYYPDAGWIPYCPTGRFYHYVDTHQYRACHGIDQTGDELATSVLVYELWVYLYPPTHTVIDSVKSQITDGPPGLSYLVKQYLTPAERAYADYVEDAWAGVEEPDEQELGPDGMVLGWNAPNPFAAATDIRYVTVCGPSRVSVIIFDVAGRLVRTLIDEREIPGEHHVSWDGTDAGGRQVPSGVYFYRLEAPGFSDEKKMIHLR